MRWHLLGERRALSLFMLGFSTTIFFLVGLSMGGAWARCFYALAAVYGLGFFALGSGWFWARWYVLGISASGLTMALLGLVTNGWNGGLAVWGGIHLAIWAPLLGEGQADHYENRPEWRERYGLDEYGVMRLKRAVKGAATALPTLVFYALAPRDGQGLGVAQGAALVAVAGLGLLGLVRMRFWGVALLAVSAIWTAVSLTSEVAGCSAAMPVAGGHVSLTGAGLVALAALTVAVSPFVVPAYRYLRPQARR